AALPDLDLDPTSASIERILDQFLHHRGGPFNDLAGGDLAGNSIFEDDYGHAGAIRRRENWSSPLPRVDIRSEHISLMSQHNYAGVSSPHP
ncbi:MAG: hypothetical protein JXA57_00110, partial [Armatimonadetes bacterium]|nr:hypothetical protein [Armatimonadota bacterium]